MPLRDIRVQLEIDTGAGIFCPITEDYVISAEAMSLYFVCGIRFDPNAVLAVMEL